ncbi:MAG: pyridoxine 5'-phosphate synthase [Verrucomicrobia bacterium]|nr:pyridoxine 5'-phosphate synthase [Verrucomicrobiota bacterium]
MSRPERIRLGVNIDHCATLRMARYRGYPRLRGEMVEPDPVALALEAERAGADGITVHPREDARHIQQDDVRALRGTLQIPLNMEMAVQPPMVAFAREIQPHTVCMVPENRAEVTTEGGLDVAGQLDAVAEAVKALAADGILSSLFIDPERDQVEAAARTGATFVELHTGAYANGYYTGKGEEEKERLVRALLYARELGLKVNMGHGINYTNVRPLSRLGEIFEMNIGHSILSRALFCGIREAVREMDLRMNGEPV